MSGHDFDDSHDDENEDLPGGPQDVEEALEEALELDTQSQIFLEMRRQNVDLLKIAAEAAGFSGSRPPLKPGDVKHAMSVIWALYSEFYSWVDPEEGEGDDEDDDEDDSL